MPKVRYKVPLLNNGTPNLEAQLKDIKNRSKRSNINYELLTDNLAIIKPERDLGAGYISDSVARNLNVNLCDFCWRKYGRWWAADNVNYRPDWDIRWSTDCMGCSTHMIQCVSFYPEGNFYKVLTESYGRYPEPNRKIYFDT